MTRSAEIKLPFAGEDRTFRLKLKQLERLQERCGERGPMRMLSDAMMGSWRIRDIHETIRLGLTGGGMPPAEADKLVAEYVEERPLEENVLLTIAILQAVVVGPPIGDDDQPGVDPPGKTAAATAGSTSPPSTETQPSLDGPLNRSVN